MTKATSELVGEDQLLESLFPDPRSRPTPRWLRSMRQRRLIPFIKMSHRFIRYNVQDVSESLCRQFGVEEKGGSK